MKKKKIKLCLTKQLLNMFKLWCEWGIRLVKTLHENLKKKLSYYAYEEEKSRPQKIPFQCHSSMERNRTICYRDIVTEAPFERPS